MSIAVNIYYTGQNGSARKFAQEMESNKDGEYTEESPLPHWSYFGYEDAYSGSIGQDFREQDYDNDDIYDRVYREPVGDTELCHYRIELGNGTVIDMDKGVYGIGFPHVKGADINGDGENGRVSYLLERTGNGRRNLYSGTLAGRGDLWQYGRVWSGWRYL